MKKGLSLILILALLCTLATFAGCKETEPDVTTDPAGSVSTERDHTESSGDSLTNIETGTSSTGAQAAHEDIDLSTTKPNEYVKEKLDAKMEVNIGWVSPTLQDEFMIIIAEGLKADFEALGFTLSYATNEYDGAKQVELVENYMEMGCAAIGLIPMDSSAYIDLINQGIEKGCYICFLGTIPEFNVPGAANVDVVESATACYEMACAWVETGTVGRAADGKVHVAVLGQCNNADNKKRSETLKTLVESNDDFVLNYWTDASNAIDVGYSDAEAALTYDNDIRVFLAFSTSSSIGVSNYVMAMPQYAAVKEEFGVFSMGTNTTFDEMVDQAHEGGDSILRGIIKQGGEKPWSGIYDVITGLLLEGAEMPLIVREHLWNYSYIDGYSYDNGL